jgi:hypothetical protein
MPAKKIRVLMLAFELPPHNSGGLGVACLGLTKALSEYVDITYLLPTKLNYSYKHMKIIFGDSPESYSDLSKAKPQFMAYDSRSYNILEKMGIAKITNSLVDAALKEDFDIIHANDWMTVEAAIKISEITKKPLVLQIHSTTIDRGPLEHLDKQIFDIEKNGMKKSDKVIAVSNYTKGIINKYFNIKKSKIGVVYNATEPDLFTTRETINTKRPIILSLGRITYQKGLVHLLESAQKVVKEIPDALFVIVGDGDMNNYIIEKSAELGLGGNIIFTGFLRGRQREVVYNSASVFVMPSISEPFGIVAVEAAVNNIPTVLSRQSGAAEVLKGTMVCDYWDTEKMANQIVDLVKNKKVKSAVVKAQSKSLKNITWENSAKDCVKIYKKVLK